MGASCRIGSCRQRHFSQLALYGSLSGVLFPACQQEEIYGATALGGLVGAADVTFWPVWCAAAAGAVMGDWVSYWLGLHYRAVISQQWPLSRHPELLTRGHIFFVRWGAIGVFVGRFFGPLRCVVPLIAGVCDMSQVPFQIANVASATIWALVVLAPGWAAATWLLQ